MKSRKVIFAGCIALVMLTFFGCGPLLEDEIKPYDTSVFNVDMEEALRASQSFVKESVKAADSGARAVYVSLAEDDKWQGYLSEYSNWNIPSNAYGTSLVAAENTLVINGEDLGTLQNLVLHKDKNGHFTKAVFEYKGQVYYVLDKGSYVVLSSHDDLEHIVVDQEGKIGTADWSSFKIWTWDSYYKDGNLNNPVSYRYGDLGYGYTLRNVELSDGSYADITLCGFNYYNYGFRVWIKESNGESVKADYTQTSENTIIAPVANKNLPKINEATSDVDFIYEVVNNTGAPLTVFNVIASANVKKSDLAGMAMTGDHTIANGGTYQFKYKLADLATYKNYAGYMGCYFIPADPNNSCHGWTNGLNQTGRKHTVTVTLSPEGFINGVNSWTDLSSN